MAARWTPLATGLLPVAFGAATKTVPYIMDGTKLYHFTLRIGEARDTDDADGQVIATSAVRPTDEQFRQALGAFQGEIMQVPPVFSAIKVAGERAYDMAREGRAPVLEPRPARVDRFELVERPDADTAVFEVQSGKGVYMRSLARDLAVACGTVGHVSALRRLRVGPFHEENAISLDKCVGGEDNAPASPEAAAAGRDRAGRHPGAGLDPERSGRPPAWPGDQPGRADGPDS